MGGKLKLKVNKEERSSRPDFFRSSKIFYLALGSFLYNKNGFSSKERFSKYFLSPKSILSTLRLRKMLFLFKVIRFKGQYYSTPTIPAFPSAAYDNMVENGGLNFFSAGTDIKKQTDSVFLAITGKCGLSCSYCYEKHNLNHSDDIPAEKWIGIIKSLQQRGVNIFILSGGEPLMAFDRLLEILRNSNKNLSDFHLHTSGNSVTEEKVMQLKEAGLKAAAIGLDDYDEERHDRIRGRGSFANAVKALRLFHEAGIFTYVNFCAGRDIIRSNRLYDYYEFVKGLNVSLIQLLEPRPCGGYFNNDSDVYLEEDDRKKLADFTRSGNKKRTYKNYPLIYYVAHIEGKAQLGCHMGGLSHFYIDSKGNVCPCVFFPITYGNITKEDINDIYIRMRRNIPRPVPTDCPSVVLSERLRDAYKQTEEIPLSYEYIQESIDSLYEEVSDTSRTVSRLKIKSIVEGELNEK